MAHADLARILLAIFCGLQGVGTMVMDLNRTHASNPEWLGHARFHVVWQTATVVVSAVVQILLLMVPGPLQLERFYLAAVLSALPIMGFFFAFIARGLYGGTLSDPNGIQPLRLKVYGRLICVDMNLVAEAAALLTVLALVAWYHAATR